MDGVMNVNQSESDRTAVASFDGKITLTHTEPWGIKE